MQENFVAERDSENRLVAAIPVPIQEVQVKIIFEPWRIQCFLRDSGSGFSVPNLGFLPVRVAILLHQRPLLLWVKLEEPSETLLSQYGPFELSVISLLLADS